MTLKKYLAVMRQHVDLLSPGTKARSWDYCGEDFQKTTNAYLAINGMRSIDTAARRGGSMRTRPSPPGVRLLAPGQAASAVSTTRDLQELLPHAVVEEQRQGHVRVALLGIEKELESGKGGYRSQERTDTAIVLS